MEKFIDRINCEWGGFNQGVEEQVEAMNKVAKKAFELGKQYENIYTDVVTDGLSSYIVFASEPFEYEDAEDWFNFLSGYDDDEE